MSAIIPFKSLSQTRLLQIIAGCLVDETTMEPIAPPGGGGAWGTITGTLSDQTDLQAQLDSKQNYDDDLASIANYLVNGTWPYRFSAGQWNRVKMGTNMSFDDGVLNTVNFFSQLAAAPDHTIASASTLDLTGLDGLIDVTGNTTINAVTGLAVGQEVLLRFTGTPTITNGVPLATPGRQDIIVTSVGGFSRVRGGASSVSFLTFQDGNDYQRDIFDRLYMNSDGDISHSSQFSGGFTIGRYPAGMGSTYMQFTEGGAIAIRNSTNNIALIDLSNLKGGVAKVYSFADYTGTLAVIGYGGPDPDGPGFVILNSDLLTTYRTFGFPDEDGIFATQTYVDNIKAALNFATDCLVASTANVNIASAPAAIDTVTLTVGDRVFLRAQTAGAENGPYQFNGAGVAMTRTTDGNTGAKLKNKTFPINSGATYQDTWQTITNDSITLGSTVIVVSQVAGAGTYSATGSIVLTGNVFSFSGTPALGTPASGILTNCTGTATGLTAGAATILATSRNINGVAFNGSANITVPAAGSTLTDTVPVGKGGTGATTLTAHGVLLGNAAGAIAATAAGAAGQVLTSNGASADPTFEFSLKLLKTASPLTVQTAGGAADIGTISIPPGITRFRLAGTSGASSHHGFYPETFTGTQGAASFEVWDGPGGTGQKLISATLGAPTQVFVAAGAPGALVSTSATLYIRQTANSANAGTISFYLVIMPLM